MDALGESENPERWIDGRHDYLPASVLSNLPRFLPRIGERNIDDPSDRDVEGKGHLGNTAGLLRNLVAFDGARGLDLDADGNEPIADIRRAAKHQARADCKRGVSKIDLNADDIQHTDIEDDWQANYDFGAKAEAQT